MTEGGYFRLSNRWDHDPKVMKLSTGEQLFFIKAITYCALMRTDGVLDRRSLGNLSGRRWRTYSARLVAVGLLHQVDSETYVLPAFLKWNMSNEQISAHYQQRAEAGRKGGIESGKVRKERSKNEGPASSKTNQDQDQDQDQEIVTSNYEDEPVDKCAFRLSETCKRSDEGSWIYNEALEVVRFLNRFVDLRLIDEEVGHVEQKSESQWPSLPRWYLKAVRNGAKKKAGIDIPMHLQLEKNKGADSI